MVVFIAIAVAMPLLCAAYVAGYERAAYKGRYDGCQGQDGYQALLNRSRPPQEGHGKGDAHQAETQNDIVAGKPLNESLTVACQANAIMRASMHVQVITYIGSLVPLGIGLLAGFIGLWTFIADLKRRASEEHATLGGVVPVAIGQNMEPVLNPIQAESERGRTTVDRGTQGHEEEEDKAG